MDTTLPNSQVILSYKEFFNEEPPKNALDLIKGLCKTSILGEFAGINYFLKPKKAMYYDISLQTQLKLLLHISGSNESLFKALVTRYQSHVVSSNSYPIIFSRHGCLFAFEQIINSDMLEIPGFTLAHSWLKLFHYIMAVNSEITKQTNYETDVPRSLEGINPQMLPLNELSLDVNPLYTPYRGYSLMEYFASHRQLGQHFKNYFKSLYNTDFDYFIYELLSMYFCNNRNGANDIINAVTGEKLDTSFYYSVKPRHQAIFVALSRVYPNDKIERLISIKKYPFYNAGNNQFLLLDSVLLMDKAYGQLINDFWFDYVRSLSGEENQPVFGIRDYRSMIGEFVEGYVDRILRFSFRNTNNQTLKTFDELRIKPGKKETEITDVYLRYKKQLFVAEVKSTGFYDDEKYSGDVNQMYKNDRTKFFSSFGVNQIVQCIAKLRETLPLIDPKFPSEQRCHVFPALIVNEKALQTPFMAEIFNVRFKELMQNIQVNNLVIYPLSLIHVSDLEHMEDHLKRKPQEFWNILRYHLRYPTFIPPFYNTLNRREIRPSFKNVKQLFEKLVLKYQNTQLLEAIEKID